jgi:polysaccharide export outer membrane protein
MRKTAGFISNLAIYLLLLIMTFSCVSRKKLIYLQKRDGAPRHSDYYYDEAEYRIKADDVLGIDVFSLTPEEFNFFQGQQIFSVDDSGMVELPALGKVEVEGLTLEETEDKIKELFQDYLKSPLVKVSLQTPFTYTIMGEVNGVGTYTVLGEELNIMEAIAQAGDLSQFADRSQVRIIREEDGERKVYYVNLLEEDLMGDDFYYLKSGDLLIVDPLLAKTAQERQNFILGLIGTFTGITLLFFNISRFL